MLIPAGIFFFSVSLKRIIPAICIPGINQCFLMNDSHMPVRIAKAGLIK